MLFVVVGVACDCNASYRFFVVNNLDEIALGITGISATLFTLTIALLALIGDKNDSYLGFNFKKFYLQQKIIVFKQNFIVLAGLLSAAIGALCLIPGFYNTSIALFCTNVILIFISIRRILQMYIKSTGEIENEIKSFFESYLESENADVSIVTSFVDDWNHRYEFQSATEFEKYKDYFSKIFKKFFPHEDRRQSLESGCVDIIESMLMDKEKSPEGFKLLYELYANAYGALDQLGEKEKNRISFHLYLSVAYKLNVALLDMDLAAVELEIQWDYFVRYVIGVNGFFFDKNDDNAVVELKSIVNFCYMLGCCVSKDLHANAKHWGDSLQHFAYVDLHHDGSYADSKILLVRCVLAFMNGVIECGDESFIKEYFYMGFVQECSYMLDELQVFSVFAVHCYMYYLGFCEKEPYISGEISAKCKNILQDSVVQEKMVKYLNFFASNEKNICPYTNNTLDVFNDSFFHRMRDLLLFYEKFDPHGDAKMLILPSVIRDYCMYMVLYMTSSYNRPQVLENVIPVSSAMNFYRLYGNGNMQKYPKFIEIILGKTQKNENDLHKMSLDLAQSIRTLCKKNYLLGNDNLFDEQFERDSAEVTNMLQKYFADNFKELLVDECVVLSSVKLLVGYTFANISLKDSVGDSCDVVSVNLLRYLYAFLKKGNMLNRFNRDSFANDEELLKFLQNKKDETLIGSKYSLRAIDYKNYSQNESVLKTFKSYLDVNCGFCLFAEDSSIAICIKSIRIDARVPRINEFNAKFDFEKKVYLHSPEPGIELEFTEGELEDYLKKNRRIFEIIADVGFKIKKDCKFDIVFA